ncbi:MAG: glycosyltransferase family 39 protein [Acidimicrobiia bacterium]|nr:glycosyltransferase family 39 protein [Acidimicrobiia bacterium]
MEETTTGRAWVGGAISLVVVVGSINLPLPFFGDQALYSVMASMMSDGAALYSDVWDLKQPGIFVFYLAGGSLFGFTELGIHILEILWWTAFMVVLWITLRRVYASLPPVAAAIVLIGASYFLVASPAELTQVEGLVGFPLYLSLWFAYSSESADAAGRTLFLSGVFGGIALLLKLIFLPIVASLWLLALMAPNRGQRIRLISALGAIAGGLALPIGIGAIGLALQGSLDEAFRVSLVYPFEVLAVDGIGYGLGFLRTNVVWFLVMFLPIHLLALVGLWRVIRGDRYRFDLYVLAWLATGGIVVLSQVSSWFTWHFLLLLVPAGLMAARGFDWLLATRAERSPRIRMAAVAVAAAAAIPTLYGGAVKALPLAANGFAISAADRVTYEMQVWPEYERLRTDGAVVDGSRTLPGPIYVFGDPTFYWLLGREQAIPIHGWTPQLLTAAKWRQIENDLRVAQPGFVHVADWARALVQERGPGVTQFLTDYEVAQESELGTWYRLRQ